MPRQQLLEYLMVGEPAVPEGRCSLEHVVVGALLEVLSLSVEIFLRYVCAFRFTSALLRELPLLCQLFALFVCCD